ncbi:MAG TPA: prolipoprotein diacylglyceryl transferase [Patescibacteria group bacterium]|jgi:phosphatidylglycerol:prolipoprotein diacylglycerol transferase|nr:prolipoprotein diacylglyceryl transferase [Patescibacteria group bacterium]
MNHDRKQLIRSILIAVAVGVLGFFVVTILMQPFFSGRWTVPQSFGIGKIRIQFYGLLLGLGALAGYWLAIRRKVLYKISDELADSVIFVSLVFGFIGARLYHVASEYPYYVQHPAQIVAVWNGGLSIFGAAIGGVLGIYICYRFWFKAAPTSSTTTFLQLLDWLTPSIIVGQIIGRFGNFVNYELYGYPTSLPWKMFVPVKFRLPPYELVHFFHPLFLYEAAGSVIILILILKLKPRAGSLFLMWLLLYNVMRFFLEFLRVGSITYGGIRVNAIVALVIALLAAILWYKQIYRQQAAYEHELPNPLNS